MYYVDIVQFGGLQSVQQLHHGIVAVFRVGNFEVFQCSSVIVSSVEVLQCLPGTV